MYFMEQEQQEVVMKKLGSQMNPIEMRSISMNDELETLVSEIWEISSLFSIDLVLDQHYLTSHNE